MGKRTRIIEGTWNCTSCDARGVLGRHKRCPHCGNPREQSGGESSFDFSARSAVDDDKALELASAGADWFCDHCGSGNRGDALRCSHCNAERPGAAPPPPTAPAPPAPPAPVKRRRFGCLAWVGMTMLVAFSCCFIPTGLLSWWDRQTNDYEGTVSEMSWERTVAVENFTREAREAWESELQGAPPPQMPVDGGGEVPGVENVRDCRREVKDYLKVPIGTERVCTQRTRQVECGTKKVCTRRTREVECGTEEECTQRTRQVTCGTEERCSVRDLGNGFAEETCEDIPRYCTETYEECEDRTKFCSESYEDCEDETRFCDEDYEHCEDQTRYRSEPYFASRCTYDTFVWRALEPQTLTGKDENPRWPAVEIGPLSRVRRTEQYRVTIHFTGRGGQVSHLIEPGTEEAYRAWKPGQKVRVTATNGGRIEQVVPVL